MAKEAARLMLVVVLPTPPFWLAIAMIRVTGLLSPIFSVSGLSAVRLLVPELAIFAHLAGER